MSDIGNTRISSSNHWCFTWNNYDEKGVLDLLSQLAPCVFVFQEENEGTPHLQGYVNFKKRVRPMETVRIPSIHWEKCRHIQRSIAYCSDEKKRKGRIWSNGVKLGDEAYNNKLNSIVDGEIVDDELFINWVVDNKKGYKVVYNKDSWFIHKCIVNSRIRLIDYVFVYKDGCWRAYIAKNPM